MNARMWIIWHFTSKVFNFYIRWERISKKKKKKKKKHYNKGNIPMIRYDDQ